MVIALKLNPKQIDDFEQNQFHKSTVVTSSICHTPMLFLSFLCSCRRRRFSNQGYVPEDEALRAAAAWRSSCRLTIFDPNFGSKEVRSSLFSLETMEWILHMFFFFPTCQVRVVRFYVCGPSFLPSFLLPPPLPPCRTLRQMSPDATRDLQSAVGNAGPQ